MILVALLLLLVLLRLLHSKASTSAGFSLAQVDDRFALVVYQLVVVLLVW